MVPVLVYLSMPNVHMLLYADDVSMAIIGLLQHQLNVMSGFCSKYGLNINMSKPNVMIVRNGGRLRMNGVHE